MLPHEHLQSLYAKKAKYDDNSTSLAQALETVIQTSFEGGGKFIFELLQNADDSAEQPISARFIYLPSGYLIFSHTGRHFSETDVTKITDFGQTQYSDKSGNIEKTGYKGIGFKAVFSIASQVFVLSKEFSFCFDKEYSVWKAAEGVGKYPWQIIPIPISENPLPADVQPFIRLDEVTFVMKLNPAVVVKEELNLLIQQPDILLFLRRVSQLSIQTSSGAEVVLSLTKNLEDNLYLLKKNEQLLSQWVIGRLKVQIRDDVQRTLHQLSHYQCPDRLKQAQKTVLTFAAQLSPEGKILQIPRARLFCYLPTQVQGGLHFLVNADFLLTADRMQLLDNVWNKFLLEKIGRLQFLWFASLNKMPLMRHQVLGLINSQPRANLSEKMLESYQAGFRSGLADVAFIPRHRGSDLLKGGESVVDETSFYETFDLVPPLSQKVIDYGLEFQAVLTNLGACKLGLFELCDHLPVHVSTNLTLEFQKRILLFLIGLNLSITAPRVAHYRDPVQKLRATRFLLSQNNRLGSVESLYFEPQGIISIPGIIDVHFIHPDLKEHFGFLKKLGMQELGQAQVLARLLELIEKENQKINADNIIEVTQFVMSCFEKGLVKQGHWSILRTGLRVLSQRGSLLLAGSAFLSDHYQPSLSLEQTGVLDDIFVSALYDQSRERLDVWKSFFSQIGVVSEIVVDMRQSLTVAEGRDFFGEHFLSYIRTYATQNPVLDHYITPFIFCNILPYLKVKNVALAKAFWRKLVERIDIIQLQSGSTYQMKRGSHKLSLLYLSYFVQMSPCVPDAQGRLHRTQDLYSSEWKSFSDVLPVADLHLPLTADQAKFFGFKTELGIDACLKILDSLSAVRVVSVEVFQTFEKLFSYLKTMAMQNASHLKSWKGLLPAQNGRLQNKEALRCFAVPGRVPPANSAVWLKEFPSIMRDELVNIAKAFGIPIVRQGMLTCSQEPTLMNDIKNILMKKLLALVDIEAHFSNFSKEAVGQRFSKAWKALQFFNGHRMSYVYSKEPGDFQTIYAYREGVNFYFSGSWDNHRTLPEFCRELGRYLELSQGAIDVLEALFRERDEDLDEWLDEKGFSKTQGALPESEEDTGLAEGFAVLSLAPPSVQQPTVAAGNIIASGSAPQERIVSAALETPSKVVGVQGGVESFAIEVDVNAIDLSQVFVTKARDRVPRERRSGGNVPAVQATEQSEATLFIQSQPSPARGLSDQDKKRVGNWGEAFVFRYLLVFYKNKYSSANLSFTDLGFILEGASVIQGKNKESKPLKLEVTWHNKNMESGLPKDLTITKNAVERIIEVKSTPSSTKAEIFVSDNEFSLMKQYGLRYRFFRVYDVGKQSARIEKIKDPASKIETGAIRLQSMVLQV